MALHSALSGIDLSQFDLDKPLPEMSTNGSIASLGGFAQFGSGKTLKQAIREGGKASCLDVVGTVDEVADQMEAAMEEVGGDGFLVRQPFFDINRRYILEIAEALVPALQRRGLVRTEYTAPTLRQTLREF